MDALSRLQEPRYWLLGILASLVGIHLAALSRANSPELLGTSLLLWMVAIYLLWERYDKLCLESGPIATGCGLLLIVGVLIRTLSPIGYHLRVSPLLSVLGLCLLASGFRGLRQYWKEILIMGLLAIAPLLESALQIIDLSTLTAKFSSFVLWYGGLEVKRQGVFIILPKGRVEVYGACSGMSSIIQMLNVAVLFFLMFPLRLVQTLICLVVAISIGFIVNTFRVGLMAVLVASGSPTSFEYWHSGNGSLLFFVISVVVFGAFCWVCYLRQPEEVSAVAIATPATLGEDAAPQEHDS